MKGFVFDLDNTLYDRYATIEVFFRSGWERARPYINPAYNFDRAFSHLCHTEALYVQGGWKPMYDQLVKENFFHPCNVPTYQQLYDFAFQGFFSVAVNHPYAENVLQKLKEKGYLLAIVTNAKDCVYQNKKIEMLGIGHYFDEIIIAGDYANQMCGDPGNLSYYKPDPSIFRYAAERLQARPEELYYVGDNAKVDVIGALSAGMVPIWIWSRSPWPFADIPMPEHSYATIEGILELI